MHDLRNTREGVGHQSAGLKLDYIVGAILWNRFEQILHQRTVRIDHGHTVAAENIGNDHVPHQRRLADTGLAEDGAVFAPISTEK